MPHRPTLRYTVRRFRLRSFLKFGFALGAAAGLVPSLIMATGMMAVATALRHFLESWKSASATFSILGQHWTLDFVELLHVSDTLKNLQYIDGHLWLFGATLFALLVLASAIGLTISALIAAIVYNVLAKWVGGLELELEETTPSAL